MSRRRHFKRTKKENNDYYQREILLNRKIRQFKNDYYNQSNPPVPHEYWHMDELRREIKYLFSRQEYQVWSKSPNRKHAYFSQLALFKSIYVRWKKSTAFTYMEQYHKVPHHIVLWAQYIGANRVPGYVFGT